MSLPAPEVGDSPVSQEIALALGETPERGFSGPFFAAEYLAQDQVHALQPDIKALAQLGVEGDWERGNFGCFARTGEDEVVSRFFAPGSGIDEDPATGSWHCMLAAIMKHRYDVSTLRCYQAYPSRGAYLETELKGDRVILKGKAKTVIEGQFLLNL